MGGSRTSRFHGRINDAADAFFYRLGYWVAHHAKLTVFISIGLIIACCFGFVNFEIETAGEDLWVPSDSLSKRQEVIVNTYFETNSEYALIIVENPSDGGSVLTQESLNALWELDGLVMDIETDEGNRFSDLCTTEPDGVTCGQPFRGVTRFWSSNFTTYQDSVSSDADVLAAVNEVFYPDGQVVSLEAVFGNSVTCDADGTFCCSPIVGWLVTIIRPLYHTLTSGSLPHRHDHKKQDNFGDLNIKYMTGRSLDDGLEESVSGEIFLFVVTYIVMIVFVQIAIGRCCSGAVRRRTWLGLGGVMFVVGAGLAAYGINSAFGIPFTSLSQILPFILIGIGVDDMFVIVAAYDQTDPALPVEERIAFGLKRCGVSVTYTSLTNFFAFILGSSTSLPAMTAFVALLTMDANRQKAGRIDWCCCFKSQQFVEEETWLPPNKREKGGPPSFACNSGPHGCDQCRTVFMKERYTPSILSVKGTVFVMLGSAALLAAGIYGATQATQGFNVMDLTPDDHYAREYTEIAEKYELEIDTQYVSLDIYTGTVDYPDPAVQAQVQETDQTLTEGEFVVGPITSWLTSFVEWAANSTEYSTNVGTSGGYAVYDGRDTFYSALAEFIGDGDNVRFLADIAYMDDGTIEISRSGMYLVGMVDSEKSVDALMDVRDVVGESSLDPDVFEFSSLFIFVEQFVVIYRELLMNFLLALVAVAVLSFFVLGKVAIVALVCFTVVVIDVDLLGFVYHWGLEVNSITVIELIMAVGLVVDYMVHIVHYFLRQDASVPKDERIGNALGEIGPSVLMGATTTFLGIMPMAFAQNAIFRVFFKMFLVIITFGCWHGVAFIPVALSLLPDWMVSSPHPTHNGHCVPKEPATTRSAVVGPRLTSEFVKSVVAKG
eukprot:jgi/Undpi1/4512/HiC_scaffold_18.g07866.m1